MAFAMPSIDITGFLSSSWIYVLIVGFIGFVFIIILAIVLFFLTYRRKIVLFENISGQGYQPILKTGARLIRLGVSGEELLKTFKGGHYVSAYGRKMGKNTYWYAKAQDGYWYNFLLGDLDAKRAMLDIEPIDRDVRMFHVALDRLSDSTYGKESWLAKYSSHIMLFLVCAMMLVGFFVIAGKVGTAVAPLAQSNELSIKSSEATERVLTKLDSVLRSIGHMPTQIDIVNDTSASGLVPA